MPTYETLRKTMKTGDLVLFSGKGGFSNVIKLFSGGKWSHVGMVLVIEGVSDKMGDTVLLWESTTLTNVEDVTTGRAVKGVQLVALSQRIANYNGEVSLRRLNQKLSDGKVAKLHALRHELSRRPYERNELELLRAAWDGVWGASRGEDLSSVFCSELVAEAYQRLGLLPEYPKGLPSNEYTPVDFSERRKHWLRLSDGYELGDEISIDL